MDSTGHHHSHIQLKCPDPSRKDSQHPKAPTSSPSIPTGLQEVATGLTSTGLKLVGPILELHRSGVSELSLSAFSQTVAFSRQVNEKPQDTLKC